MKKIELAIRDNNTSIGQELCTICSNPLRASIPIALFRKGTYDLVCKECGKSHAPELESILTYFYENNSYYKVS